MVMTRGLKRKAQEQKAQEQEAAAIVIHHLYSQSQSQSHSQPPLSIASPASSSHLPPQTPASMSTLNPCTPKPQSEIVSSCLTTMAVVEVGKPPLQLDPVVKPCSVVTSRGCPNQYFRQVSCKRNTSTAATGAIIKGIDDGKVDDGIHVEAPLFEINHSPATVALVTKPVDRTECSQSLSPLPFLHGDLNDHLIMPNEHKLLQETFMPINEDRSKSMGEAHSNGGQTSSLDLSAMDSLDDDGSSFCSEPSSAVVTVGSYRVKEKLAPILKDIIAKYGDIAARCCKKSFMLRSWLVENVCDIVQKLQAAKFVNITSVEVDSFRIFVEDLASDDVEVGWLLQRLNEISEAKKLLKGSSKVKQAIKQNCQAIKEIEKELKMRRAEERRLDEILSCTKAQLKRFHRGSMVDGLL